MDHLQVDIAVIGGGILGLWTANMAIRQGYSVLLLEANALGSGQTIASQGVLHGGVKYQVGGGKHGFSNRLAEAATIWDACLEGEGPLDLSAVRILSPCQYLWVTDTIVSGLQARLTAAAISSRTDKVCREDAGKIFATRSFKGALYRIHEKVIDVPSLVARLSQNIHACKVDWQKDTRLCFDGDKLSHIRLQTAGGEIRLAAQRYLFCAGEGNHDLIHTMKTKDLPTTQNRPLHQVFVKKKGLPALYLVCSKRSKIPRLVLTTHFAQDGDPVWYLGGGISETGVGRSRDAQISQAAQELARLFPWVDLTDAAWGTLRINRAEPQQANGKRPEGSFFASAGGSVFAWPTKLVLAPQLAKTMLDDTGEIQPRYQPDAAILARLARPKLATPYWDHHS